MSRPSSLRRYILLAYLSSLQHAANSASTQIISVKSKGFVVPNFSGSKDDDNVGRGRIWTDEEKRRMRVAIQNASSLAEMASLEKDYAEGRIPKHILEGPDPMEG